MTARLCIDCNQVLTDEEVDYYGYRCEKCESEWAEEIYQWRNGGENEKFDKMFSIPKETTH